eukprot:270328_1
MSQRTDIDKTRCEELSSTFQLFQATKFHVEGITPKSNKKEIVLSWKASTPINANQAIADVKHFIESKFKLPNNKSWGEPNWGPKTVLSTKHRIIPGICKFKEKHKCLFGYRNLSGHCFRKMSSKNKLIELLNSELFTELEHIFTSNT